MSHMFIAVNGDNVGESIGNAIISDNHDELSRVSGSLKSAHQMLDQWVQSKGGKVIVSSGDEGIYTVPQEAINELEQIRGKYNKMANTTLTVGVGSTMSEASKALIYGKMNEKNQVVHYESAIDDYISSDPEAHAQEQANEESLPTEEEVTDAGNEQEFAEEGGEEGQEEGDEDGGFGEAEDGGGETEEEVDPEMDGQDDFGSESEEDTANPASSMEGSQTKQQNADLETGKNPLPKQADAPALDGSDEEEEPTHEQGMGDEEQFAHDAEENQDDEEDADNVEADEEQDAFGGNTEPLDEDLEQDVSEDVDNQLADQAGEDLEDDGELNGSNVEGEVDPEADMSEEGMDGDMGADMGEEGQPTDDTDDEGMGSFGDDDSADQDVQELSPDEVQQDDEGMNPDEQSGIMSEMLHANMGDEEAEDSDDEVKQDIIESLMQFKANKASLEEMKQTNPEMYQANILMLRSMIQMAKKLGMNPERGMAQAHMNQDTQDTFPPADDNAEEVEDTEQNPLLGKSEDLKKARVDEGSDPRQKQRARAKRAQEAKAGQKGVHNPIKNKGQSIAGFSHRQSSKGGAAGFVAGMKAKAGHAKVLGEIKDQKAPNLPKSEDMTKAKVDQGKDISQKITDREQRNNRGGSFGSSKQITGSPKPSSMAAAKKVVPNLPKNEFESGAESVMNKAKVDEGKTPAQKQVARAYRNDRTKDEESKKITGTPKKKVNDPKAFTKNEEKSDVKKQ